MPLATKNLIESEAVSQIVPQYKWGVHIRINTITNYRTLSFADGVSRVVAKTNIIDQITIGQSCKATINKTRKSPTIGPTIWLSRI